jgi:TRAP-type C4-dicarboxylate transport system permease small subunit
MPEDRPSAGRGPAPSRLLRASDALNVASERLLFVLMLAMIFFTTLQVVTRVFFTALSWTEEITIFLLVAASLVGTAIGFKRGSHIAVTLLAERLSAGGQKILATLVHLLAVAFFAVFAFYGVVLMRTEAHQISPALEIPMFWVYSSFPVVGCLILLHLAAGIAETWRRA